MLVYCIILKTAVKQQCLLFNKGYLTCFLLTVSLCNEFLT